MRGLKELSRKELEELVIGVVEALWTEDMELSSCHTKLGFAPERSWTSDEIEIIGNGFADAGLRPDEPSNPRAGFDLYEAWRATRSDSAP
jgi:hypothetical protein